MMIIEAKKIGATNEYEFWDVSILETWRLLGVFFFDRKRALEFARTIVDRELGEVSVWLSVETGEVIGDPDAWDLERAAKKFLERDADKERAAILDRAKKSLRVSE